MLQGCMWGSYRKSHEAPTLNEVETPGQRGKEAIKSLRDVSVLR